MRGSGGSGGKRDKGVRGSGGAGREVLSSEFWVLSLSLIRKPRRARAAGEVRGEAERVRGKGLGVRGQG